MLCRIIVPQDKLPKPGQPRRLPRHGQDASVPHAEVICHVQRLQSGQARKVRGDRHSPRVVYAVKAAVRWGVKVTGSG